MFLLLEITCNLTFYHDGFYYFKNPLLPHHVSALFHLESHTKRNNEVLFQEKDMETPFMHAKKSTNFRNKKKKRTNCCAWWLTNSFLSPSIVTVKLLHQWSVAHCFSNLCFNTGHQVQFLQKVAFWQSSIVTWLP